jgi:amino acid transporter
VNSQSKAVHVSDTPQLKRSIGLTPLIFYGLGTMVGGGFYALIGRVVGVAGPVAPIALALSGLLALLSAASFAELSSRYPVSAGEVEYVWRGFHVQTLATIVGWLVIVTGVVSAATLAVATVGFVQDFVPVPEWIGILGVVVGLGVIAGWGIGESVVVVFVIAVIEVGALLAVGVVAGDSLVTLPERLPELTPMAMDGRWTGLFSGAFLMFYSFIGFEDMVNIAEEVKRPRRNLPIAIIVGVCATTVLYVWIALVAVLSVDPVELAAANTPVARIVGDYGWYTTVGIGLVSLLAGVNGALVQVIMAARVAYGMATRGHAPIWLGRVHPTTRTPLLGTAIITIVVASLALFLPLTTLARTTSAIMLVNFTAVNLALWRLKAIEPDRLGEGPRLPRWLPLLAAGSCVAMLLFQGWALWRVPA